MPCRTLSVAKKKCENYTQPYPDYFAQPRVDPSRSLDAQRRLEPGEVTMVENDPVNRPAHYARFKIEPIYFIMENDLPFWAGNVVKYTLRYDAKDGLQDLKKARRYLDMQIAKMEGKQDWSE